MVHARQYGSKLVYSGGVAQNIVANSKIRDLFDEVHIAIAPSDAGSALGCASNLGVNKRVVHTLNGHPI